MCSRVLIHLHHHGDFTPEFFNGNANYGGGNVDIIEDVDNDRLLIMDFENYVEKYKYNKTDFHYSQCDGHTLKRA